MLSKSIIHSLTVVLKVGYFTGAFPYEWNRPSKKLKLIQNKGKQLQWLVISAYSVINTLFMAVRLGQAFCCMSMSYGKLFMNLFNIVTWTCASAFNLNTVLRKREMVEFVNQIMMTNAYFEARYPNRGIQTKSSKSSVKKFTYGAYFYCACQLLIATRTVHENPKYWLSLAGITKIAKWKLIPFGLFESYMSFTLASILLFNVIVFLSYVKCTQRCLQTLCAQKPADVPRYYRMLQALNNQFNLCFKSLVMPFIFFTLLLLSVLSNYASIRLFHEISIPAFLGFLAGSMGSTLVVVDTFPTSYQMYESSERLLATTKELALKNGYVSKVMRSCRPLSVDVGFFFPVKQATVMTFLEIAVDNAIMMLLSF